MGDSSSRDWNQSTTLRSPTVSVVICAYTEKRWDMLVAAMDSVVAQSYPVAELILCIDHNPEMAERCRRLWGDREDASIPTFVLENKYEGRLGSARNTGVEQASSEIVAFLDDDAAADRDWLKFLVAPYQRQEVVAVGGAPLPVFETVSAGMVPAPTRLGVRLLLRRLARRTGPGGSADRCIDVGAPRGARCDRWISLRQSRRYGHVPSPRA